MTVSELRALHQQHRFRGGGDHARHHRARLDRGVSGAGRSSLCDDGYPGVSHELSPPPRRLATTSI